MYRSTISTSGNVTFLGDLPIWSHTATLLANGTALIFGGVFFNGSDKYNDYGDESLSTAQLYDPHQTSFFGLPDPCSRPETDTLLRYSLPASSSSQEETGTIAALWRAQNCTIPPPGPSLTPEA